MSDYSSAPGAGWYERSIDSMNRDIAASNAAAQANAAAAQRQSYANTIMQSQEKTNAANKKRETEIRTLMDQIIGMYQQGGSFGKGVEAQLERERTKSISAGSQSLISSGLFNTTQTAGLAGKFAEEVAMPTRMKLEDLRMEKLSSALGQKASFIEGITDQGPDYRLLASLLAG